MRKTFFLFFVLLAAGLGSASAQKYPERSLVRKGNRDFGKARYERSIERYTKALDAAPDNFEAGYDLGNALYRSEKFEESARTLERAAADTTRTCEERADAFYNLGNAQFRQEKYAEALESYKNALRMNPADTETKYNYAYTKRLLQEQQQQEQEQQQQNDEQEQNRNRPDNEQNGNDEPQEREDDKNDPENDNDGKDRENDGENDSDRKQQEDGAEQDGQGEPRRDGISPEEQQRMLDAIQAQEDKTQEKLKEKAGVAVRGNKNW